MSDDIRARIEGLIKDHHVMLFMKGTKQFPACGFSNAVVEILKKEAAPFETFNILSDPEMRQALKEYSNWPTFPQLYVGGKFVGGCDIVTEMHQSGELKRELAVAREAAQAVG
ncbi:MAG TPA: Grx4 family monothiol glutaredoxin [Polyangiaceae bacterium]|nr:Grx4 family monothiol glutaredoxin [Polyangiaceae bacterium]